MSKPIKLQITDAQLEALLDMADEMEAWIGGGDDDGRRERMMRLFNNFCKKNGIPRNTYAPLKNLSIPNMSH